MTIKARQAREAIAMLAAQTRERAADRRARLATAVAEYLRVADAPASDAGLDEADAKLEAVLLQEGIIEAGDSVTLETSGSMIAPATGVLVLLPNVCIEIDAHGNTIEGRY